MKEEEINISEEDELRKFDNPSGYASDQKGCKKKLFKEEDMEARMDCTYILHGNKKAYTGIFYCLKCDELKIEPMCDACYNNCHQSCITKTDCIRQQITSKDTQKRLQRQSVIFGHIKTLSSRNRDRIDQKDQGYFICNCGKNKHKIFKKKKVEISKCELDKDLGFNTYSYCRSCGIFICVLCVNYCHGDHEILTKADLDNPSNDIDSHIREQINITADRCNCTDGGHKTNSFVFDYYLENMKSKYEHYTAKLFNTLILSDKLFHNFFEFARNIIMKNSMIKTDIFQVLAGNSISAYLSSNTPVSVLNLSKNKTEIIFSVGDPDSMKQFEDFVNIILCYFDKLDYSRFFYNEKMQQVIPYKRTLTFVIMLLYDKNCENAEMYLMACKVLNILMHMHFRHDFHYMTCLKPSDYLSTSILERISFRKQMFKHIDDRLKEKYFSNNSLKIGDVITQITELLVISFKDNFKGEGIDSFNLNIIPMFIYYGLIYSVFDQSHMIKLINVLNRYEEILTELPDFGYNYGKNQTNPFAVLIKVAFMMAVTYNDITVEKTLKGDGNVHNRPKFKFLHENGESGQIFLRLIFKFSRLFKNQEVGTKYFILYQETLKLFGLCQNFYTDQIEGMTLKQIQEFQSSKIEVNNSATNNENLLQKVSNEIKRKIENFLMPNEFDYKMTAFNDISFGFSEVLQQFTEEEIQGLFIRRSISSKASTRHGEYKYHCKIFRFFEDLCSINLIHSKSLEDYSLNWNFLIHSNIDIILSAYFRLDLISKEKHDDLKICLAMACLYFLSKKSFKHICYGNKLSLIVKRLVNKGFCENSLNFIYLFTKGLDVYNLDLSRHKVIQVIKCLRTLKEDISQNSKIYILKIFKYLAGYFDFQYLDIIKMSMFNLFKIWFTSPEKTENFMYVLGKNKKILANENESEKLGDYKLFLALFDILSQKTFFTYLDDPGHCDMINTIHGAFDISSIKKILSPTMPTLKDRIYILKFIRSFHFITRISSNQWVIYEYLTSMQMRTPKEDKVQNRMDKKIASNLLKVIAIFIKELENLDQIVSNEKTKDIVQKYLIELLFSVKRIADFVFIQKDIWSRFTWYLYKLTKRLIAKSKLIKEILLNINNEGKTTIPTIIEKYKTPVILPILESVDFDVADKRLIYHYITFYLNEIFSETKLNEEYTLSHTLKRFDAEGSLDFGSVGVINTQKCFEDFYPEEEPHLDKRFTIKTKLKARFLNSLSNFASSTFLKVIQATSIKKGENYSKNMSDFFICFMGEEFVSDLYTNETPEDNMFQNEQSVKAMLILNTKMLYFAPEITQKTMEELLCLSKTEVTEKKENMNNNAESNIVSTVNNNNQFIVSHFKESFCKWKEKLSKEKEELPNNEDAGGIDDDPSRWLYDLITNSEARDKFLYSIFSKLQANFLQLYASSENFLATKTFHQLALSNKAMIQFLQLLSQRFNINLITLNIKYTFRNSKSISIFDLLAKHLERVLNMLDLDYCEKLETSQLKLLTVWNTLCDFFVAYIEACGSGNINLFENVKHFMKVLIQKERIHRFLLHRKKDFVQKDSELIASTIPIWEKTLLTVQVEIMELIIAFIELRWYSDEEYMKFIVLLTAELPWMAIFDETLSLFARIVKRFEQRPEYKKLMAKTYSCTPENFIEIFTYIYQNEKEFENSLELTLCLKYFTYLKMMTVFYGCKTVDNFFEAHTELKKNPLSNKSDSRGNLFGLFSSNSFKVYKFLNRILIFVEVEISDKKKVNAEDSIVPIIFFKRPSITFFLTKRTRDQFMENVNRDSHAKKQNALVKEFNYFLYEMMYNSTMNKRIQLLIMHIDFVYFEIFNYMFILIHQGIFLASFSNPNIYEDLDEQSSYIAKSEIPAGNKGLAYLQIAYIIIVISFWFVFQFKLSLRQDLMDVLSIKFLTKKNAINEALASVDESKRNIDKITPEALINSMKDDPSFWVKLKIGLLKTILANKAISTFFYTLVLLVIYLLTGNVIVLASPVLLIVNFNKTLGDIVHAIQLKWLQLLSMLIFTYLCIYFFSWITFYFYSLLFIFDDSFDFNSMTEVTENHCRSAIQCYLTLIDQGFRNGGGIGEILPKISWKTSTGFYIARFAYVILFHIFIILILGNIFFGIIVDAFKSLREKTDQFEEDKKNKCFLCNITLEKSLNRNMDFNSHVSGVHNAWNYIYFLTYLVLNDQSTFNVYEYRIREKISSGVNDNSWMPREAGKDDEEK